MLTNSFSLTGANYSNIILIQVVSLFMLKLGRIKHHLEHEKCLKKSSCPNFSGAGIEDGGYLLLPTYPTF